MFRHFRKKRGQLSAIGNNLSALASHIEMDLTQLQLADSCDAISQSWNRLIQEVTEARRELEACQVQKQACETLDRFQRRWAIDLLNKMPYGLLVVSEDLRVTFANATAARLLGSSGEDLLDRTIAEIFDESLESLGSPAGGTLDRTVERESPRALLRLTSVKRDEASKETAIFVRDVSQEKESERARDEFLYHVTHELRTPLTNIRAYAETLSEGVLKDPDSWRECYNVIIGETQRLSRLVEDILRLSQLEVGSARLTMDDVQTARLIRKVVEDMQASADEKGVELVLSMPAKVATIRGDKERLAVVLTNLIGNAIKYTPSGERVEVSCAEDGARLRIEVRDTGIGIGEEDQERIFEKFYRSADDRVAQQPGTGLGLAIARETVRAHGGAIEVESELGRGSTFRVVLPIGKSAAIQAWEAE